MKKTMKAIEPEGLRGARKLDEDDVEGHRHTAARAIEPEGLRRALKLDEDDVEGHRHMAAKAIEPEGHHGARKLDEDDDTEGHSMANALIGREISRAREIEIQRNLRAHAARDEASRPHKK